MVTPFGKELRKIRIDHNEILMDMAEKLEVSPAFLSAVETGKKNVPSHWVNEIAAAYRLSAEKRERLSQAAIDSTTQIKMNLTGASDQKREVALVFARQFDTISDETVQSLLELIQKRTPKNRMGGH